MHNGAENVAEIPGAWRNSTLFLQDERKVANNPANSVSIQATVWYNKQTE